MKHSFFSVEKGFIFILLLMLSIIVLTSSNLNLFLYLNKISLYSGNILWINLTHLGDAVIIFALSSWLMVYRKNILNVFFIGAIITSVVIQSLKFYFNIARPPGVLNSGDFILLQEQITQLSFPSGHSATAFLIAAIIFYKFKLSVAQQIILLLLASLIAFSRIAVGVHWPIDVLTGALMGWGFGYIAIIISSKLNFENKKWLDLLVFVFYCVVLVLLLLNPDVYSDVFGLYYVVIVANASALMVSLYKTKFFRNRLGS